MTELITRLLTLIAALRAAGATAFADALHGIAAHHAADAADAPTFVSEEAAEDPVAELQLLARDARFEGSIELADAIEAVLEEYKNDDLVVPTAEGAAPAAEHNVDEAFNALVNGDLADLNGVDVPEADDLEDQALDAVQNMAGGPGWEPTRYAAKVERWNGQPFTADAADLVIGQFELQARMMMGSFDVVERHIVGNTLNIVVEIDPDVVRERSGSPVAVPVVLSACSAADVPGLGLIVVSSITAVVDAEASTNQRDGMRAWRDLYGLG